MSIKTVNGWEEDGLLGGVFNREKITFGGNSSVDISSFESEMRKQNLHLTSMKG